MYLQAFLILELWAEHLPNLQLTSEIINFPVRVENTIFISGYFV